MATTNTFAGARIDRAGERRTDADWLRERLADPTSRALLVGPDGVLVDASSEPPRPLLVPLSELSLNDPVLLGVDDLGALFAARFDRTYPLQSSA